MSFALVGGNGALLKRQNRADQVWIAYLWQAGGS
jgi:hypothetical protein